MFSFEFLGVLDCMIGKYRDDYEIVDLLKFCTLPLTGTSMT